jgi:alpha-beta hydrolase superfamily lysophospholipase
MGAYSLVEYRPVLNGSSAKYFYFGPDDRMLAGWLHVPRVNSRNDTGLVICQPFGYEAICSHRAARTLAEAACDLQMPALRFDYLGCGDSDEIDSEADQIDVWLRDVLIAIEELQRLTGVTRVCLLGFRMGALLAVLAAIQCAAVDGLVLIAPVVNGRRHLRELRMTRLAGQLGSGETSDGGSPDEDRSSGPRSLEISGYSLSAASLSSLSKIDLMTLEIPARCETLVLDGASLPAARAWSEHLIALGRPVRYSALPAVLEMMITAPQFLVTSPPMIDAARDWLAQHLDKSVTVSGGSRTAELHSVPRVDVLTLKGTAHSPNVSLIERPAFFGLHNSLFGIVTEPDRREVRRRAVILLNAGADHHVGPSRIYVTIARRWARRGYFVLRMDLAGLGDSGNRPGRPDDEVFPPEALQDVRAAIDLLKTRYGIRDITLAGLCSGAYHALRAAVAGLPAGRILMVNPLNYFWKPGMALADLQVAEVIHNPGRYREHLTSSAAWKRLLSGRVNVWRIVKIYAHRALLPLQSLSRDVARSLRIPLPYDLGRELEQLISRGVRITFVFSRGEPGIELLKIEGGAALKRLGNRCRVRIIDRADHSFSHSRPRAALEDILSEELFAPNDIVVSERAHNNHGQAAKGRFNDFQL